MKIAIWIVLGLNFLVIALNFYILIKTHFKLKKIELESPYNVTGWATIIYDMARLLPINVSLAFFDFLFLFLLLSRGLL